LLRGHDACGQSARRGNTQNSWSTICVLRACLVASQDMPTQKQWACHTESALFLPFVELASQGGLCRVDERLLVAHDRLCRECVGCGAHAADSLHSGADRQELDEPAAELVDVALDPDDVVGAARLGLSGQARERVVAGFVDELAELGDLAADERLERGSD